MSWTMPESIGRAICLAAIREERCGEMFLCLFDGGSVTVDAVNGNLILMSGEQLNQLAERSDIQGHE